MKYGAFLLLQFCCFTILIQQAVFGQQTTGRPKIGITLSGGGAKGMAHIGILKALDSAGINVDYITGTSMGSIMAGLYAIGYSGNQIEEMARKTDWGLLLTNQSTLEGIIMEEKDEYGRYAVELPYSNHRFHLYTGILESEELWLKLSELFYPVFGVRNFNQFSIPFKCVATNAANGEAVILDKGEIVTAIRASMAIPSVFTSVEIDGKKLVDGGVIKNFPVSDVKKMGADYVIGVNVSDGVSPASQLNNPIAILMNAVFFKAAEDAKKEIPLCNIYIPMPVHAFSSSSFGKAGEIIDTGVSVGNKLFPVFKKLKDSLDAIYGPQEFKKNRLPVIDSVYISSASVSGLEYTSEKFFLTFVNFKPGRKYLPSDITDMIRMGFGHRYYNRITYTLDTLNNGAARINFNVTENSLAAAKFSVHYNKFTGIALIANFTIRNLFSESSRTLVTANLGERFRVRGEHMEFLGKGRNFAAVLGTQYEFLDLISYENYRPTDSYRQGYFLVDLKLMYSNNRKFTLSVGTSYERLKYTPSIQAYIDASGKNSLVTSYLQYKYNTLDRKIYPNKGIKINALAGFIYGQEGRIIIYQEGKPIADTDSLGLQFKNYSRLNLIAETYLPLWKRGNLFTITQVGFNFNYDLFFLNDYYVGGLTRSYRNQVVFAGYQEAMQTTSSQAALQIGYRHQLFNNIFLLWRSNGMFYDIIDHELYGSKTSFLSGHAFSVGYLSAIGPIELSVMYGDQSKLVSTYVNIGIPF